MSGLLPTLTKVSLDQAAPSFYRATAMARRRWSHLRSVEQRLTALDVGDPQPVGTFGAELPLNQIRPRCGRRRFPPPAAAMNALHANEFHAPPHPLMADLDPVAVTQLSLDTAYPVGVARRGVNCGDGVGQLGVVAVAIAGRPGAPFMEA
ncbi:hypothetical protein MKUB_52750 [Mycobacterium kubicae]|uniref:Uncharacterized protein n=1 Tax=Mycobacterium kubicae TaxID=120959 RepID=A0ABQ1BVL4_9MYCO|nr:hypothetical protein MKUB_52750 [Mycobacterium kubicae]